MMATGYLLPGYLLPFQRCNLVGRIQNSVEKTCGGFADIHQAELQHTDARDKQYVAIKYPRQPVREQLVKEFLHEFRILAKVKHPNILPLLGFTLSDSQKPGIVIPWMAGGNLHQYLERHRHMLPIDKKLCIICQIGGSINYLHDYGIIHCDITDLNILMDPRGTPFLMDFGLSATERDTQSKEEIDEVPGNVRWMARELVLSTFDGSRHARHSRATDVWAFGMILYRVITEATPYSEILIEHDLRWTIAAGDIPRLPAETVIYGANATVYNLAERLWLDVVNRPSIAEVMAELEHWNGQLSRVTTERGVNPHLPGVCLQELWRRESATASSTAAISADGSKIAVGGWYGVEILSATSGESDIHAWNPLRTCDEIVFLCFSPSNAYLAAMSDTSQVTVWHAGSGEVIYSKNIDLSAPGRSFELSTQPACYRSLAFSHNNEDVLTRSGLCSIAIHNTRSHTMRRIHLAHGVVRDVTAAGVVTAPIGSDGPIRLLNPVDGSMVSTARSCRSISVSDHLFLHPSTEGVVHLHECGHGVRGQIWHMPSSISAQRRTALQRMDLGPFRGEGLLEQPVVLSKHGTLAFVTSDLGVIRAFDIYTGDCVEESKVHWVGEVRAALSESGSVMVTISRGKKDVKLWKVYDGRT